MFLNEAPVRRNTDRRIRRTVAMPFNKGEEIEEKGTEHDRFCRVPVRDPLTLPEIHMVTWMDGTCLVRGFQGLSELGARPSKWTMLVGVSVWKGRLITGVLTCWRTARSLGSSCHGDTTALKENQT